MNSEAGAQASLVRKTRILIVDDHPIVREGLRVRISSQHDMEVCGEAAGPDDALGSLKEAMPDLVIVDISLANGSGLDLIGRIKAGFPRIKMLVLSAHDDLLYAERAIRAGAHGYINKGEAQGKVLDALRTVRDGGRYLSPVVSRRLIGRALDERFLPGTTSTVDQLSNRELQVFQLIGQGRSNKAIAEGLHLSHHTIDRHREKIKAKLGLSNSLELHRAAMEWTLTNR